MAGRIQSLKNTTYYIIVVLIGEVKCRLIPLKIGKKPIFLSLIQPGFICLGLMAAS